MNNVISFEAERNKREVVNVEAQEGREGTAQPESKEQYSLQETHFENGERAVETVDGQLLKFDYVDTRAIIASHEAVNKDREMQGSKVVLDYINGDAHREAQGHATEHIDETAKQAIDLLTEQQSEPESNDVFARTFRQFTSDHGSHSLFRLRSIPNWSWAESNQGELAASLKSGFAYMLPKELAKDMVNLLQYYSSFGIANSNERTKSPFVTGNPRGGDGPEDTYMTIPITLGDGDIVQLYFLFGATEERDEEAIREESETDSGDEKEHSSTVDRLAA